MKMIGEPDAGNPHVRFDEGVQETCFTRRACALLYRSPWLVTFRRKNERSEADRALWPESETVKVLFF